MLVYLRFAVTLVLISLLVSGCVSKRRPVQRGNESPVQATLIDVFKEQTEHDVRSGTDLSETNESDIASGDTGTGARFESAPAIDTAVAVEIAPSTFEAKYADIPLPLGMKITRVFEQSSTSQNVLYGTSKNSSKEELVSFYSHEMERLGWHQACEVSGSDLLLTFNKPQRFCTVIIKDAKNRTGIELSVYTGVLGA